MIPPKQRLFGGAEPPRYPLSAPDPTKVDMAKLKDIAHLFIRWDYLDRHLVWGQITPDIDRFEDALRAQGGKVEHIDLPKQGIRGNFHMQMMDRNSDQIAQLAQDWMTRQGLMK